MFAAAAARGSRRAWADLAVAPGPLPVQRRGEPAPRRGDRGGRRRVPARHAGPRFSARTTRSWSSCAIATDRSDDVAFVGGIDLCHSRRDDATARRRPAGACPWRRSTGARPPWHDVQLAIRGPAVGDVECVFRERWTDPTPAEPQPREHSSTTCCAASSAGRDPLPPRHPIRSPRGGDRRAAAAHLSDCGSAATRSPDGGERSVARAYAKALGRARRLVYVEDQYLWSAEVGEVLRGGARSARQSCAW